MYDTGSGVHEIDAAPDGNVLYSVPESLLVT
jgi:hypothetical protein